MSNECMRANFEPLYYQYGVDFQFHGANVPHLRWPRDSVLQAGGIGMECWVAPSLAKAG